jgi:hypothetical protein
MYATEPIDEGCTETLTTEPFKSGKIPERWYSPLSANSNGFGIAPEIFAWLACDRYRSAPS